MKAELNIYESLVGCGLLRFVGKIRTQSPITAARVSFDGKAIGDIESIGEPVPLSAGEGFDHFVYFDQILKEDLREGMVPVSVTVETAEGQDTSPPLMVRSHPVSRPPLDPEIDPKSAHGPLPPGVVATSEPLPAPDVADVPGHSLPSQYYSRGRQLGRLAVQRGYLSPGSKVLDVGCGLGVVALFYGEFLDPKQGGFYWGIDVRDNWIEWCERNLTSRYPHLRFHYANLDFSLRKVRTPMAARFYRFPFPDASFDLVVLNSVFTHMLPEDVAAYLDEIARVLKPGGTSQISYFLLDDETREACRKNMVKLPRNRFVFDYGDFSSPYSHGPLEKAIAYDAEKIANLYKSKGFEIVGSIPGKWGRPNLAGPSNQDFIFAKKL